MIATFKKNTTQFYSHKNMENIYDITITLSREINKSDKIALLEMNNKFSTEINVSNNIIHFCSKGSKKTGRTFSKILSVFKKYGLILGKFSLLVAHNQWIIDACQSILPFKKTIDLQSLFNEFGEEVNQTNFISFTFFILPILKRIFSNKDSKETLNAPTIILGDNNIIKEIKINHIVNK